MLKNTSVGTLKTRKEWIKPQKKEGLIHMIYRSHSVHQKPISSSLSQKLKLLTLTVPDCHAHWYGSAVIDELLNHKKLKQVTEKCKDSLTFLTVSIPDSVWGRWVGVLQVYRNNKHLQRLHLIVSLFTANEYLREYKLNYFFLMPRQLHPSWAVSISLSRYSSWDRNGLPRQ